MAINNQHIEEQIEITITEKRRLLKSKFSKENRDKAEENRLLYIICDCNLHIHNDNNMPKIHN